VFQLGRTHTDGDKKKKKVENHAEERIKNTYNLASGSSHVHDELKRKREDFAV
jgi:hypothetical protein